VGISSLQIAGDIRKKAVSPPSFPSDSGYVERIVDLQCFWMDKTGCFKNSPTSGPCNDDGNGWIDEQESWEDYELVQLGGIDVVDKDRDCLIDPAYAQPSHPVDELDQPLASAQIDSCTANLTTATAGTITVAGCTPATYLGPLPKQPYFLLENEILSVTSVSGQDVNVRRGVAGTTAAAHAAATPLRSLTVSHCPAVPYSAEPNIVLYNKAADQDCDGLVDGIEKAWGSNDQLADSDSDGANDFVEMFQQTNPLNPDTDGDGIKDKPENNYIPAAIPSLQCGNNWDDDGDLFINDGCPPVNAAENATTQCADNVDSDSDTVVNDGCPTVDAAEGSANSGEKGEAANLDDNCPGIANPGQENNDGQRRDNGDITGSYASNPNQDKMGDACDPDDDNDAAPDNFETTTAGTNPFKLDSDWDTIQDGAEIIFSSDPKLKSSIPPTWSLTQQLYYRGCHQNLPAENTYGPYNDIWDAEYDSPPPPYRPGDNGYEMDIDGDGSLCPTDPDSDNGTGTGSAGPAGYPDRVEGYRYALGISNYDTDGDTCPDWIEISDLDGNRQANLNDLYIVAGKAFPNTPVTDAGSLARDVDANLVVANNDVYEIAKNSKMVRPTDYICPLGED
jgi:hypothetical protein